MKKLWNYILGICGIIGVYLFYLELTQGRAWEFIFAIYPVGALVIFLVITIFVIKGDRDKLKSWDNDIGRVLFFSMLILSVVITLLSVMLFWGENSVTGKLLKINGNFSPGQILAVHIKPGIKSISGYYDFHGSLDLYSANKSKLASHKLDMNEGFKEGVAPKMIIGGVGGATTKDRNVEFGTTIKLPSNLSEQKILLTLKGNITYLASARIRSYMTMGQVIQDSIQINVARKGKKGTHVVTYSDILILLSIMSQSFSASAICLNIIITDTSIRRQKT